MSTVPMHDSSDPGWVAGVAADLTRCNVSAATGLFDGDQVERLADGLDAAVAEDARFLPADRYDQEFGRVLFLPSYGAPFLDLLDDGPLHEPVDATIGAGSTLYTMTSACTPPGGGPRALHQDSSLVIDRFPLGLGVMVLLDDFDERNGATRFSPVVGPTPPAADQFEQDSLRLVGPAGSVCWFHGAIWHDTTRNDGNRPRRCIILAFIRPFVRQRFDMPRMLAHLDPTSLTPERRRRLGFHLQAPGSYDEYYLPPVERERLLMAPAGSIGRERTSTTA